MSNLRVSSILGIDGSTIVTTSGGIPYLGSSLRNEYPRVFVAGSQNNYTAQNGNGEVPWNLVLQGNVRGTAAFNTSNGRFTAPVAGEYLVSVYTLIQTAAAHEYWIAKNGTRVTRFYTQNDRVTSGTCLITCAVNDFISIIANSNSTYLHATDTYSGMTIAYLG